MKKNTIYVGFHNERLIVMDYLSKNYDWEPVFVLGPKKMKDRIKNNYNNAIFYESAQLRNGQFDYTDIGKEPVPIDSRIIEELSKFEAICFNMMEDTTGWNFSCRERRSYYYEILKFFNTAIHHFKPDLFICWTLPHLAHDYVFYHLCNYYKIPVLCFNPTPLFNHNDNKCFHATLSLEDQSKIFIKLYESDNNLELSDETKSYLKSVRSENGMTPPYINYYYENPEKHWNSPSLKNFMRDMGRILRLVLKGKIFQKIDASWKCNRHPFESKKSKMNYLQFVLFKARIRQDDRKLRSVYFSYVKEPDLTKKYVYYAAAFQPEAGIWSVYQDQFLCLDIISVSIPDDWIIYYKEHPNTFTVGQKASLLRNKDYFEKISKYRNVQMVDSNINTFKMIDSARVVATPAGTVGWESVVRGVPAMIFSSVWYEKCKSVFIIKTLKDCQVAIEKIRNGYRPDQSDVERFAAAVEHASERNVIHGDFVSDQIKASSNPKFQMERIAKALYQAYEQHYSQQSIRELENEYVK